MSTICRLSKQNKDKQQPGARDLGSGIRTMNPHARAPAVYLVAGGGFLQHYYGVEGGNIGSASSPLALKHQE